jgi:uncharacterized protein (DUF608 family)
VSIHEVMRREHKPRSGLPLGGIGAGWFELRKDGQFYNWNIFNNEPLGSGEPLPPEYLPNSMLFFVVRYQKKGEPPRMKLLQVDAGEEVGTIENHIYTFPWMTGVDEIEYDASFPFSTLIFRDADMPFEVTMRAWSPFVPHDVKNSSLPAACFDFRITPTTQAPVDVMLLATMRNAVGYDHPERKYVSERLDGKGYKMFQMSCDQMPADAASHGTQAVASLSGSSSWYLGWEHRHPYYEWVIRNKKLRNFDDTEGRNNTDKETGKTTAGPRLFSSIAASKRLTGGKSFEHSFVTTWHFPNLYAGQTAKAKKLGTGGEKLYEGHYYNRFFDSAADVARYVIANRKTLAQRTEAFHDDFFDSTAPRFVLDQVNSQMPTFLTSSWLTEEGNFGIQEGMTPGRNWGPLATIDVGMYGSVMTAALFPELDHSMIRAHQRLQHPTDGSICHGIGRNFQTADVHEAVGHRLDLPSQYVIMALRGYFWTSDKQYLQEVWPSVTAALEYVLRERDHNGDLLPDMEGSMCTYDNFPMYGAASYVASLWLAALAYAAKAAEELGEPEAAGRYAEILRKGEAVFEEKLWNGEYYRLYNDVDGQRGDKDEGCLADQIIGQWAMHFVGLGDLLKRSHIRKALRTVMKTNFRPGYGLLNCRWPEDEFLHDVEETCWSDQANTAWSGVELAFASFLIYEGLLRDGLKVVRDVDDRYRKAGMYFDHQEFGGHYYRPMSAWGIVNALAGLTIDDGVFGFDPKLPDKEIKLLLAFGGGTVHYVRRVEDDKQTIALDVRSGTLRFSALRLGLAGKGLGGDARVTVRLAGKPVASSRLAGETDGKTVRLDAKRPISVKAGRTLTVTVKG